MRPLPELDEQFETIEHEIVHPERLAAPVATPYSLLPAQPRAYRTDRGWVISTSPTDHGVEVLDLPVAEELDEGYTR